MITCNFFPFCLCHFILYNLGASLWGLGLDGKFRALTVSFLIVHFFFFFSSANTIFNAFSLFLWISGFFFTCVSALQILAKFSSLNSKCVVKVFCLTLVLIMLPWNGNQVCKFHLFGHIFFCKNADF